MIGYVVKFNGSLVTWKTKKQQVVALSTTEAELYSLSATLKEILDKDYATQSLKKEKLFRELLVHPLIKEIRGKGLMLAAMTSDAEITNKVIFKCQDKGLILFWLLFETKAIRISPPLTISEDEIREGCGIIIEAMNEVMDENR